MVWWHNFFPLYFHNLIFCPDFQYLSTKQPKSISQKKHYPFSDNICNNYIHTTWKVAQHSRAGNTTKHVYIKRSKKEVMNKNGKLVRLANRIWSIPHGAPLIIYQINLIFWLFSMYIIYVLIISRTYIMLVSCNIFFSLHVQVLKQFKFR